MVALSLLIALNWPTKSSYIFAWEGTINGDNEVMSVMYMIVFNETYLCPGIHIQSVCQRSACASAGPFAAIRRAVDGISPIMQGDSAVFDRTALWRISAIYTETTLWGSVSETRSCGQLCQLNITTYAYSLPF